MGSDRDASRRLRKSRNARPFRSIMYIMLAVALGAGATLQASDLAAPSSATATVLGASATPAPTTLRLTLTCTGKDYLSHPTSDAWDIDSVFAWVRVGDHPARLSVGCAPRWQGARRSSAEFDLTGVTDWSWLAKIELDNAIDAPHQCTFEGLELPSQPLRCSLRDAPHLFDEPSDAGTAAMLTFTLLR